MGGIRMPATKKKDTMEEIREIIRDLGESHKRTQEKMEEVWEAQQKTEAGHQRAQKEMEKVWEALKKTEEIVEKQAKSIKKANDNFNTKWGRFMEDLVKGDLINLLKKRKIEVIRPLSRVEYYREDGSLAGDVDIIAVNGKEIVAVEVKTHLEKQDINKFIYELLNPFKKYFPEYSEKIIYGCVAYLDKDESADEVRRIERSFCHQGPGWGN